MQSRNEGMGTKIKSMDTKRERDMGMFEGPGLLQLATAKIR